MAIERGRNKMISMKIENFHSRHPAMTDLKANAQLEEFKQKILKNESIKPFHIREAFQCVCCGEILTKNHIVVTGPNTVRCPWQCGKKMEE